MKEEVKRGFMGKKGGREREGGKVLERKEMDTCPFFSSSSVFRFSSPVSSYDRDLVPIIFI